MCASSAGTPTPTEHLQRAHCAPNHQTTIEQDTGCSVVDRDSCRQSLRRAIEACGSVKKFAERLGFCPRAVASWLSGQRIPRSAAREALYVAVGIEPDDWGLSHPAGWQSRPRALVGQVVGTVQIVQYQGVWASVGVRERERHVYRALCLACGRVRNGWRAPSDHRCGPGRARVQITN